MYSVKNLFTQEPASITGFIIATLNLLVLAHVFYLSKDLVLATNGVLMLGLNLFYVRPLSTSTSALRALGEATNGSSAPVTPTLP